FDNFMRASLHKPYGRTILWIARMKCGALAPMPMRIDKIQHFGCETGVAQGVDDKVAFPPRIGWCRQRLHRAAAAMGKIAAVWRDPIRTRSDTLNQLAPAAVDLGGDCFPSQGIGHKDHIVRRPRNPFSALSKPVDGEL